MVVGLALSAIAGAIVTSVGLFPAIGAWSLLFAPVGGSCAAVVAGLVGAATQDRRLAAEPDVDHMVGTLRSVLDDTAHAEAAGKAPAEQPAAAQRIAG